MNESQNERDMLIEDLVQQGRLRVDEQSGLVYADKSNTPAKAAGSLSRKGYLRICVNVSVGVRELFYAHRVVWVSVNGPVPAGCSIDHLNCVKTDNRISNLEAVSFRENTARAVRNGLYAGNGRKNVTRDCFGRFKKIATQVAECGREV